MSHQQDIARVDEMYASGGTSPISDARRLEIQRAALASAQRRAYQAEQQAEKLRRALWHIAQGSIKPGYEQQAAMNALSMVERESVS